MPKATTTQTNINYEEVLKNFYKAKLKADLAIQEYEEQKTLVTAFLKSQPNYKSSIGIGEKDVGFSLRVIPVYKFSSTVLEMEGKQKEISEKISEVKKKEIESGTAQIVDNRFSVLTK